MSPNRDEIVEATKLFVEQIRLRPMNVVANLNVLLEEHGIELAFVQCRQCNIPQEASLFDHQGQVEDCFDRR